MSKNKIDVVDARQPARAILLRPLEGPRVIELPLDKEFEFCRAVIGGYVEIVALDCPPSLSVWHLAAYVNEDGISLGMRPSHRLGSHTFFGPVVVVRQRVDAEGETEYASPTREELAWITENDRMLVPVSR